MSWTNKKRVTAVAQLRFTHLTARCILRYSTEYVELAEQAATGGTVCAAGATTLQGAVVAECELVWTFCAMLCPLSYGR